MTLSFERMRAGWARARRHGVVECEIDWAGPVESPVRDETGVQAACGIMHVHGRAAGRPVPLGVDYASAVAGVLAAQGTLAVKIARARGAKLDSVRTSVSQAALLVVSPHLAAATSGDGADPVDSGGLPFLSSDGVSFEIDVPDRGAWQGFWERVGADAVSIRRGWPPFHRRFATATCALPAALHDVIGRISFQAVATVAQRVGASAVPVREAPVEPIASPPFGMTPLRGKPMRRAARRWGTPGTLPLEGVVVVEATRRVQGPLAGHVLRMLGAEVIRIEPPEGNRTLRASSLVGDRSERLLAFNSGKRTVELDPESPVGQRELRELVVDADVFLHNWPRGRAEQLGLGADALARARPGLVYASASGWGDAFGSEPPLDTDLLVQAHSGLAAAVRPSDEPPAPSLIPLAEVLGGVVCAEGVLAALLSRVVTGNGWRVESSLLSAVGVLPQRSIRPTWNMLDHPLRTQDGYLALSRSARQRPHRVAASFGLHAESSPESIAARCASVDTATCLARLDDAELAAVPVCTDLRELAADPRFSRALDHDGYVHPAAPWEFS